MHGAKSFALEAKSLAREVKSFAHEAKNLACDGKSLVDEARKLNGEAKSVIIETRNGTVKATRFTREVSGYWVAVRSDCRWAERPAVGSARTDYGGGGANEKVAEFGYRPVTAAAGAGSLALPVRTASR